MPKEVRLVLDGAQTVKVRTKDRAARPVPARAVTFKALQAVSAVGLCRADMMLPLGTSRVSLNSI